MSSSVDTVVESYRKYSLRQRKIHHEKALGFWGKWVTADNLIIQDFRKQFSYDPTFTKEIDRGLKTIWKVVAVDGIMVLNSNGGRFWAQYLKEVVFQDGEPSQEEIDMYTMVGYEILP